MQQRQNERLSQSDPLALANERLSQSDPLALANERLSQSDPLALANERLSQSDPLALANERLSQSDPLAFAEEDAILRTPSPAPSIDLSDDIQTTCIDYSALTRWAIQVGYECAEAFVFGSALFPMEAYGTWAALDVVSGSLVIPIKNAIDELLKNQDIRVFLQAEHAEQNGSAVAGFAKILGKHIAAPLIPVAIAAIAMAGPKDLGHPFSHAALHTSLGYFFYKVCSTLANAKWSSADPDFKPVPLNPFVQWAQSYIADPLLVSFPRALLLAEFLGRTGLDFFMRLKAIDMYAPVVFAGLYSIHHFWRSQTKEQRTVQPDVEFEKSIVSPMPESFVKINDNQPEKSSEQKEEAFNRDIVISIPDKKLENPSDESILDVSKLASSQQSSHSFQNKSEELAESKTGCLQKIGYIAWPCFKGLVIYGSGVLFNTAYTQVVGTLHDDSLGERIQRSAAIALGMNVAAGALKGVEKLYNNYPTFFSRRNVALPQGLEPLLTHEPRAIRKSSG
jgi:hypothetical protein